MTETTNSTSERTIPPKPIRHAGFGIRLGANIIDFLILLPLAIANFYNILNIKSLVLALMILTVSTLYKPLLEFLYQATWGKMAVGLKVVNDEYERIDLTQAILRYFPWLITHAVSYVATILMFGDRSFGEIDSFIQYGEYAQQFEINSYSQWIWLIILVSALAIFFTSKKQAVHDMVAGTYVVYKD